MLDTYMYFSLILWIFFNFPGVERWKSCARELEGGGCFRPFFRKTVRDEARRGGVGSHPERIVSKLG